MGCKGVTSFWPVTHSSLVVSYFLTMGVEPELADDSVVIVHLLQDGEDEDSFGSNIAPM